MEFIATGDIGPCRADAHSIFAQVRNRLQAADLCLGQLEPALSDRGTAMPQARLAMRAPPATAAAIKAAGFDVVSFASNHCMDWGTEALLDTLRELRAQELQVIGAGENLAAAKKPALFTCDDTQVALLAYNSILPMGYWAEENRAGCAPVRSWTVQEQVELDQPGTPSRTHSFAHAHDLAQLVLDIQSAKAQTDVVILSMHWGIHFVPKVIATYQREIAHAAIDAGASLVVGHHPHVLKGIEVYRGKVIAYSLGNFALDSPSAFQKDLHLSRGFKEIAALNPNWRGTHKLEFPESRKTIALKCNIEHGAITNVSALPVFVDDDAQPKFLRAEDAMFTAIAEYLQEITHAESLSACFEKQGDEIAIVPPQ